MDMESARHNFVNGFTAMFFELFKNGMLGGDQNMWMIEKVASILFF
jgi:hypothetical protein